ncbi:YL1 nuclear protein-domain-containing protein [Spinellus fusiger]|nr:YL1 nuclear protein-domain-containing protein [Spinellus fusiger]
MTFVLERARRPNAGSRMQSLLDKEAEMEVLFEDNESDDEEFLKTEDEQEEDVVDSDFLESSEGEADHEDQGQQEELQIAREEKRAKRAAMRHDPVTHTPTVRNTEARQRPSAKKPRERVVSVEATLTQGIRHSSRMNTVLNRLQVEEQLRESELRKALLPKRDRPVLRPWSQEELLSEAAITEQENLESLEQWQLMEADRRAKAKRKDKRVMTGPFVRYHSYTEGTPDERPKNRKLILIVSKNGRNCQSEITDPEAVAWQSKRDMDESEMVGRNLVSFFDGRGVEEVEEEERHVIKTSGLTDRDLDRTDLVPELMAWLDKTPKPVHPMLCPITGQFGMYRDPTTLVPFTNKEAFGVIKSCQEHTMRWCSKLGIYLGCLQSATGVPEGWDRMMTGKRKNEQDWLGEDGSVHYPGWWAQKKVSPKRTVEPTTYMTKRRTRQSLQSSLSSSSESPTASSL